MIDAVRRWAGSPAPGSVLDRLCDPAFGSPHRIALVAGETALTRAELAAAALRLARRLVHTAAPGAPVGLLARGDARLVIGALACLAAGLPFIPLDAGDPPGYNTRIAELAGVTTVAASGPWPPFAAARGGALRWLSIDAELSGDAGWDPSVAAGQPLDPHAPCTLFAVPQPDGVPALVVHSQHSLGHSADALVDALAIDGCDRMLIGASPATFAAWRDVFAALGSGAVAVLHAAPFDPAVLATLFATQRISVLCAPPLVVHAVAQLDAHMPASALRMVHLDGETIGAATLASLRASLPPRCRLSIGFGSVESGLIAQRFVPPGLASSDVCVGRAIRATQIDAVDGAGVPVPDGTLGALRARGPQIALGTWRDGALVPGPALPVPKLAFREHHEAVAIRRDAGGSIWPAGRLDRRRDFWGRPIELGAIEAGLRECRGVAAARVIVLEAHGVERLAAFVVRRLGSAAVTRADIRGELGARFPAHAVPGDVRFLEAIPMDANGAPDEAALAAFAAVPNPRRFLREAGIGARPSGVAFAVAHAWSEIAGTDSLLADECWAASGGDAFRALALGALLERHLGRHVALPELRGDTCPSALIGALAAGAPAPGASDDRRALILLPGLPGENARFAAFAAHFAPDFRCITPTYLQWYDIVRGESLAGFVDDVVAQVLPRLDARPVALVGHSFGGLVAHEVARRLVELGHPVGLVAILDTDITLGPTPPAEEELVSRTRGGSFVRDVRIDGLERALGKRIAHRLTYGVFRARGLRRILGRHRSRWWLPSAVAVPFDGKLSALVREEMARAWAPRAHSVATLVLRCRKQTAAGVPHDLGWSAYARDLRVSFAGGTHHSMIAGSHGRRLALELTATMAALP